MGKGLVYIIIIALVIIAGLIVFSNPDSSVNPEDSNSPVNVPEEKNVIQKESASPEIHIIEMTPAGFSPSSLTISKGDKVQFVSAGAERWPASNIHPTHTIYPGSSIQKCGSSQESEIFDSCGSVSEYSFTFDEIGSWGYHDHLSPGKGGIINVQ